MTRDNLLFAIIGILLGFILGFMLAGSMSQREAAVRASATPQQGQNLPPNHPPVDGSNQAGSGNQMQAEVQADLDRARKEPKNFEAQLKAAGHYYQIQMFDQAIEHLLRANQLQPDDYQTVASLGMVNMDAGRWDAAEKWYKAALVKRPDDITVLDGLCFVFLSAGKTKPAEDTINKLEKIDPTNQDLAQFRSKLAELKSANK